VDDSSNLSLYLHIPFCRHRCAYCDFNTYVGLGDLKERYADALAHEVRQVAGGVRRGAKTIYYGGGTPSLMSINALGRVMVAAREAFELDGRAEVTLEANPDTVDVAYLEALQELGFNRLSFGMQSAVSTELAMLEREHELAAVVQAVQSARTAGFANFNLDLIYGLPGQSLSSWDTSLRAALDLGPQHLSLYCLTIESGTPMKRWLDEGRIALPDPDLAADQFEHACRLLREQGFDHYEISNWALPGYACRHNLSYWRNESYLGFGAGAHGHAAGYRYSVVKQPRVYLRRMQQQGDACYPWSSAAAHTRRLTRSEQMSDTVITQLRLLEEGLDLAAFEQRFGQSLFEAFPGIVEELSRWRLVEVADRRLRLARQGRLVSNQVLYRFV
jgi:oxygen-independent coproporphyrinogen III oxidase